MGEIWGRNGRETAVAEWRWGQASHLFGDAASPVIVGQVVDMILAGHNCCEGCEKCPCVPTSNGSGSWDDSCALPNCAWANATVGMASGCTNSNGAEVSAYLLRAIFMSSWGFCPPFFDRYGPFFRVLAPVS